jgi:tetratricopeptide (TPR) repeat protein
LRSSGRYDEAVKAFDRALELYPIHADAGIAHAQKGRGDSLTCLGKHDEALEAYGAAVEASDEAISAFNNATPLDRAVSFTFDLYPLDREFWHDRAFALHSIGHENTTDYQIDKAEELAYNSSFEEVISALDEALKMDPRNETILIRKASYLNIVGRVNESSAQENTTEYWTMIGDDLAMNESNYQGALVAFEKAIQIDPENMGAWDRKALIHYVLSKQAYLRVLSLSEKWLENNPQDARAWQARAAALQSLDRIDESNQSLEKAIEIYDQETRENPGNATAWFYKAEVMANRTDALAAYEKVIELNGSMEITAMLTKGNILLNLGKSEEAIAVIDKAIQLDPKNPQAWKEKALDSYVLGKYNESLAAYEMVIELEPEYAPAWIWKGKGDALKALGRQSEADAAYARAEELNPLNSTIWAFKGQALTSMATFTGNESIYNESLEALDNALQIDPKNHQAWYYKGAALKARGCNVEANAAFAKADNRWFSS